jgi:hypothetical protein
MRNSIKVYKDYSMDADVDSEGILKVLSGKEAVENALRQWITSFRGEYMRNPQKGGYVTYWLLKPLNDDTGRAIKEAILEGIYEDFTPQVVVSSLSVVPNYTNMSWEITLEAYSPVVKEPINIYEELRHLR